MLNQHVKRSLARAISWIRPYSTKRNVALMLIIIAALGTGSVLVAQLSASIRETSDATFDTALVLFAMKVLTYVFAPLGGAGLKVLAGSLFGWHVGFLIVVAGDTAGSLINYILGRQGVKLFRRNQQVDPPQRVSRWSIHSAPHLIVMRFLLSPAWDIMSYGLGAKRVRFSKFLLASIVGGIPASALWAFGGDALASLLGQSGAIILAVGGVVAGVIAWIVYKIVESRRATVTTSKVAEQNGSSESE